MTYEAAMITCEMVCDDCRRNHIFVDCIKDECANYLKKQALEKQIPKKPIKKDTEKPCLYCPACGVELFVENHHCKCGQAIDWSDE